MVARSSQLRRLMSIGSSMKGLEITNAQASATPSPVSALLGTPAPDRRRDGRDYGACRSIQTYRAGYKVRVQAATKHVGEKSTHGLPRGFNAEAVSKLPLLSRRGSFANILRRNVI